MKTNKGCLLLSYMQIAYTPVITFPLYISLQLNNPLNVDETLRDADKEAATFPARGEPCGAATQTLKTADLNHVSSDPHHTTSALGIIVGLCVGQLLEGT